MTSQLHARLQPVRMRQRLFGGVQGAAWGLLYGAIAAVVFGIARWLLTLPMSPWWGAVCIGSAALVGALGGWIRRHDWRAAARAVDTHYRLKDRTATALAFLTNPKSSPLRELQVDDALRHLETVDVPAVVPWQTPKTLPYAVVLTIAAALLLTISVLQEPVVASPAAPLDVVVAQSERLADELKELEKFSRENPQPEIDKLVEELKAKIEELKQPGVDQREALATLSEMQAKLQALQQQYDVVAVDSQMQAIAEALSLAESLASVSKPLKEGRYDHAAEQLEKLDAPALDRKTEKAVKEKLAKLAQSMRESGQQQLGEPTGELSEGLGEDSDKFRAGAKKLASESRKQSRRKKLDDLLRKQCECLGECKSECEGECQGTNPSKKVGKGGKKWGLGQSGNEPGKATLNLGAKQEQKLTGKMSDNGDSEIESTHSPEGKQDARRQYRENYDKYQKISEAVLDSEPIPLGHRQTIRRYFEFIRPQAGGPNSTSPDKLD